MEEYRHLQRKYISFIGSGLERFQQVDTDLWRFRCPYCGDSKRSKTKARGFIYLNGPLYGFKCHNCGEAFSFYSFLKFVDAAVHREYLVETFRETGGVDETKTEAKREVKEWQEGLYPATMLSKKHPVVAYLNSRKIPRSRWGSFWYSQNFGEYCRRHSLLETVSDVPRILTVETDVFGNAQFIIAREIGETSDLRYVTVKVNQDSPKVLGLGSLVRGKPGYVCEGWIDSLFVDNCIATLDSNLLSYRNYTDSKLTLIWDNEPRSPIITGMMDRALRAGESVVIWPSWIEVKDINNMIQSGIEQSELMSIINKRTYRGQLGILELNKWKKTNDGYRKY